MEVRSEREQLADVHAHRSRRRLARERFRVGQRHNLPAVLQHAVGPPLGPPQMGKLSSRTGAENAARHIHRPDYDV